MSLGPSSLCLMSLPEVGFALLVGKAHLPEFYCPLQLALTGEDKGSLAFQWFLKYGLKCSARRKRSRRDTKFKKRKLSLKFLNRETSFRLVAIKQAKRTTDLTVKLSIFSSSGEVMPAFRPSLSAQHVLGIGKAWNCNVIRQSWRSS